MASSAESMEVENRYTSRNSSTTASEPGDVAAPSNSASNKQENAVVFSPELLQMYYARLFPFDMIHQWLSYGKQQTFSHREFSFTIEPVPGEEIYIRYQSFQNKNDLAAAVNKRRPIKIDIGAVFSHPPVDHNTVASDNFKPAARELVFDIDLTDYDEIRRCGCSGARICGVCWGFMKMAVKVVDEGLREDFGFEHIGWFYSGRRGVHCWVCDESARDLTDAGRSAVANYFEVNLGTDKNKEVNLPHPLHPMLARSYAVLEPMFVEQVLPAEGHGLLASEDEWVSLLQSLPEAASPVRENLTKQWGSPKCDSTPAEKWEELKKHLAIYVRGKISGDRGNGSSSSSKAAKTFTTKERNRLEQWCAEVVFRYTYPRLDINVSKMRNHLLKSPFCVHPKTGRVCVPVRAASIDDFDPFAVPTLPQLMRELDQFQEDGADDDDDDKGNKPVRSDWQKTSLKRYFDPFVKEFLEPLNKAVRRSKREEKEQEAALVGDF